MFQLVDRLRSGETFEVSSDRLVTPTYAPALARAVVELTRSGLTGAYHLAGPKVLSRVDFARAIAVAYGLDASLLRPRATSEANVGAIAADLRRLTPNDSLGDARALRPSTTRTMTSVSKHDTRALVIWSPGRNTSGLEFFAKIGTSRRR